MKKNINIINPDKIYNHFIKTKEKYLFILIRDGKCNIEYLTFEDYIKKVSEITKEFDFVEDFLIQKENNYKSFILETFQSDIGFWEYYNDMKYLNYVAYWYYALHEKPKISFENIIKKFDFFPEDILSIFKKAHTKVLRTQKLNELF